ncbi:MAG: PHP-associated domain-containing protein [Gemmatimonadales bacterium]
MVHVDLHCHSRLSTDAWTAPDQIVRRAIDSGLDHIAITDHDRIATALELKAQYPEHVIVGEEIKCAGGTDLIALFISRVIPPKLSVRETAERVRDQGGIVYAPHPYAYATRPVRHAEEILDFADVVEVFNSRAFLPWWNRRAMRAARDRGLPTAASSDAHFPHEFGRAYTEMPTFKGVDGFRESLLAARAVGLRTGSPWLHVGSMVLSGTRRLFPGMRGGRAVERAYQEAPF